MARLFLIPTPLGNLDDMAPRSRTLLTELPVLFCEDTRTTSALLAKLELAAPSLLPLHDHNERKQVHKVLRRLDEGDVGLVSEAGTPVLSDPGYIVVRAAIEAGHEVVSVPGPDAAVAAVVGSGLPADSFVFLGFPPRTSSKRRAWIEPRAADPATLVLYVSPRRVADVLVDLAAVLGPRSCALAVNLSKQGEAWFRGTLDSLQPPDRGEMTLVVAGSPAVDVDWTRIDTAIDALAPHVPASALRDALASLLDVPKRPLYQRILAARAEGDQRGS